MIRDCVVTPEKQLTTVDETERETQSRLFEDPFEINHEAATSGIDRTYAGSHPVRGISPVQIDMKEVFALLAENEFQLREADCQETAVNQKTYSDRDVSCFCVNVLSTKVV